MYRGVWIVALVCVCVSVSAAERVTLGAASAPAGWRRTQRVAATHSLHLTFALKQQNVAALEEQLRLVSEPSSALYGRYLTVAQVQALVAPSTVTVQTVSAWLRAHGIKPQQEGSQDYLSARVSATLAEQLLHTQFWYFTHTQLDQDLRIIRADGNYSLPAEIAAHVDFVGGVAHFPSVQPILQRRAMIQAAKKRLEAAVRDGVDPARLWSLAVDPAFLRQLYNVGSVEAKSAKNKQAVAQFLEQYYSSLDLDEFFLLFWRSSLGQQPAVIGPNPSPAGTEASLDIEYIMAMGSQVNTTFWSTSGRENNQEPFLQWMLAVNQMANPPLVFSVSYGDDEDSIPLSYANRLNTEFMKAGARGISILFASGDDGVGGGSHCKQFVPNYPASSPYVTAVGATMSNGFFESGGEVVASLSGGGFSNYFGRPSYQSGAVEHYLSSMKAKLPPQAKWNVTGRAYPDVSAQGMDYVIVINLVPLPGVAGTSCACPVFSGVVSLLNDLRLQQGKSSLGFLNPMLYQMAATQPSAFNDITKGSNPGCGTAGFPASAGWDPSSGLGSPNYAEMAKYIATLP